MGFSAPGTNENAVPTKSLINGKGGVIIVLILIFMIIITNNNIIVVVFVVGDYFNSTCRDIIVIWGCKGAMCQVEIMQCDLSTSGFLVDIIPSARFSYVKGGIHCRWIYQSGSAISARSICGLGSKQDQRLCDGKSTGIETVDAADATGATGTALFSCFL